MKVLCKSEHFTPYIKGDFYDCEISNNTYYVIGPRHTLNYGYSDKFTKEYFNRYFIDIKELRKLKLKKILNEN